MLIVLGKGIASALVLAVAALVVSAPVPPVVYRPPVEAPVTDPFRPPAGPYGPGNRGIEYGTAAGAAVRATAAGVVTFAGVVAGARFVTVAHADGLRSTVGALASATVAVGARVEGGDLLGRAAGPLLWTLRRGRQYLDPATVLTARTHVRLVPDDRRR